MEIMTTNNIQVALLHFRSASIPAVYQRQKECWKQILRDSVNLPTPQIQLYDEIGNPTELIHCDPQEPSSSTLDSSSPPDSSSHLAGPTQSSSHADDITPSTSPENTVETIAILDSSDHTEETSPPSEPDSENMTLPTTHTFLTTMGGAIHKVIGITTNLVHFDQVRSELKSLRCQGKPAPTEKVAHHDHLLTQLQTAVLYQKSAIRTQIRKYQQSYFNQHMNPPPSSDPTLKTLIKQRDVATKLLQT